MADWDTGLQSDMQPTRSGAVPAWQVYVSGNVSTIVAGNSGAFAPAGMLRVTVSGVTKNVPYFNL